MKDEILGVISAVLIGVIVALVNKWSGVDGQDKMAASSQIKQAIIDLQEIQNATIDGTTLKMLATGLKETAENFTKDTAKANPAAVEEVLRATRVAKVSFATEVAQEIKTVADEQKSPQITKTLPKTPATTVQMLITEAAAATKYDVILYSARYQNRDPKWKGGSFQDMKKWWLASTYAKGGYAYAFLNLHFKSTDDVWATAVSYNVKMGTAGTLEMVRAGPVATKEEYRVATFRNDTKQRLEAAGQSKDHIRVIIWSATEMTQTAASDYFTQYLLENVYEHIYSPSSGPQKGFLSYEVDKERPPLFTFAKA
jgi:hypothetical protein